MYWLHQDMFWLLVLILICLVTITSKTLFMWSPCSIFLCGYGIKASTLWLVLKHKRLGKFLLFLFNFLNCCKNCCRPATSSSRFGLEFGGCDTCILFFKIHDHLEWYFLYIYFVKFWFSKSFEIAAVLNYKKLYICAS